MAVQLKLVRTSDFENDTEGLVLYDFFEGFSLDIDGWIPKIPQGAELLTETLKLLVKGTSHDDLAVKLQALDALLRKVPYFSDDPSERYGIWLRTQLPDETGERQALIKEARGKLGSSILGPPVSPGDFINQYILALQREAFWEPSSYEGYTTGAISCLGGVYDYTTAPTNSGDVVGDVPARIALASVHPSVGGPLHEAWLGFRTDRMGDLSKFVSTWECEDGTMVNSTGSVGDATASDGNKAMCTFADASLLPRVTVAIEDVVAAPQDVLDQRGSYIVLLRAKVSAGTCRVRLLDGMSSASNWRTRQRVVIDSTSWLLYDMGTVTIPSIPKIPDILDFYKKSALRIEAERITPSGSLDLDCLILIPYQEGALYINVNNPTSTPDYLYAYVYPDGQMAGQAAASAGGNALSSLTLSPYGPDGWSVPIGDGRIVVAAQRAASHVLADTATFGMSIFERWRTLRGAE